MYETTLLSDQQKVDCKKKGRAQHHISSSTEFCVFLGTGGESSVHPRSLLMLAGDIEKNPGPNRESVSLNSEMRVDSLDNRTVGGGRNFSVDINEESLSLNINETNGVSDLSMDLAGNLGLEQSENSVGREIPSSSLDDASSGGEGIGEGSEITIRVTCVSCNTFFRSQYRPLFCIEPRCLAVCHLQEICTGLSPEQRRNQACGDAINMAGEI